ncbi:MAG: NAD(P)H-dependent oxidoreductase subunit E [Oscillospiraceae bacterium]|nr:NAD(P)H-dependent oxidoreductase subunit E [Oscillospiraceae bacterium]
MKNKLEVVPFVDSPEQQAELKALIESYKDVPGALVQVLQKAQLIYGYLPLEVQITIAEGLDVSLEEVYGVVTFYSFFSTVPKGKYRISVCLGTACYVKGSQDLLDELEKQLGIKSGSITADGKYSLDACRCVGACGLAPVLMVNDDVYGKLLPADIAGVLAKYAD